MERRVAKTSAVSATATIAIASVTIAILTGGIFVAAAGPVQPGVKTVEVVDDYIVVHAPTTTTTTTLTQAGVAPVEGAGASSTALELTIAPARAAVLGAAASVPEPTNDQVPPTPAMEAPDLPDEDGVHDDSDHDGDSAEDESDDEHHDDQASDHADDAEEPDEAGD